MSASKGIAQGAAGRSAGGLPRLENLHAVDDDMADAFGVAARILVGRGGAQSYSGIEEGQIGLTAGADEAAVQAADASRWRRGNFADAFLTS